MVEFKLVKGDITQEDTDGIVNAANSTLLGGGGVDGAIHRSSGPELKQECNRIRKTKYREGLPTGKAVMTRGYELKADYVIHTVGPVYKKNKDQSDLLKNCIINSLKIAEKNNLESVSFPAISTGAYGYPKKVCAKIMKDVLENFEYKSIKKVRIVLYTKKDLNIFKDVFGYVKKESGPF